ncbi:MAG: acyltransferase [Hyphomicrobiales bacterium]
MRAAEPLVVVRRTMRLERLATARASRAVRPGWSTILIKAFSIVARDEPWLRTYYLKWPWPHFYEVPKSVAMVAMVRDDIDKDAPLFLRVSAADEASLDIVEACIRHGKTAPLDKVPSIDRALRITRLPLPLRRMIWAIGMNVGRQRANNFGTFSITSIASLGTETVVARVQGPSLISYGLVRPDHTMELLYHWDHRIYDGILAARVLRRLEEVLNTVIADELLASGAPRPPLA